MIDLTSLPIFPCNLTKEPLTAHGFKSAKRGARGWKGWPLVGFPTGAKSGFDILDIDPRGRKWFDQNYDALPQTLAHSTHRGLHLVFKHAIGLACSSGKIAEGIDVRSTGGYAIYWPATGLPFEDHPVSEWPEWLLAEAMGKRRTGTDVPGPIGRVSDHRVDGQVDYRTRTDPNRRIRNLMRKLEHETPGNRNHLLNWTAYVFGWMLVEGFINTRRDAETLLRSGAHSNGLWRGVFDGPEKCKATIKSGLDAGTRDASEVIRKGTRGSKTSVWALVHSNSPSKSILDKKPSEITEAMTSAESEVATEE
jgi:hypothetical protein